MWPGDRASSCPSLLLADCRLRSALSPFLIGFGFFFPCMLGAGTRWICDVLSQPQILVRAEKRDPFPRGWHHPEGLLVLTCIRWRFRATGSIGGCSHKPKQGHGDI